MEITRAEPALARTSSERLSATSAQTGKATLGYDSFLQLLIAQVQNQDPLEPTASSDYIAQLATFSQVEKSVQTNEKIAELLTVSRFQQAESLIGRTVGTADGKVSGIVTSARVVGQEVIVVLTDGTEVRMEDGVTVSSGDIR
jgi:flagellar basal-body rod modification protein FlgD